MVTTEGSSAAETATPTPPPALPKSDVKFGAQKRRRKNGDEADLLLVKTLDKHLSNVPNTQNNEEDDTRMFCLSLVKTIKGLDARKKSIAKMQIQQVLFNIQFGEE